MKDEDKNFVQKVAEEIHENPQSSMEEIEEEMRSFADSRSWEFIRSFISGKLETLASGVRKSADTPLSIEEVGYRFLVADSVNSFAMELINFVEKYRIGKK